MKKLKIVISILIVIILLIIVLLACILYSNKSKTNEKEIIDLPDDSIPQDTIINISSELTKETNDYKFFAVADFINKFLQYANTNNQEAIKLILDKSYTGNYNNQNLVNNIKDFYAQTIYKQEKQEYAFYYVYGYIELLNNVNNNDYIESYYEVYVDNINATASIIPLTVEQYNEYTTNAKVIEKKTILSNEYNNFQEQSLSNWNLAEKYLYDYIFKINHLIEKAYNILDTNYKETKFSNNIENFKSYIDANKEKFDDINITNCTMNLKEQSIEYIITDANNSTYTIERKKAMDYTIKMEN